MGSKKHEAMQPPADECEKEFSEAMQDNFLDAEATDVLVESEFVATAVLEKTMPLTDNVGEVSVEIDVESLIADFEAEASEGVDASGRVRRRLDAILERKRRHEAMIDFCDYELDA